MVDSCEYTKQVITSIYPLWNTTGAKGSYLWMQTCTESESEKANDFTSAIFVTKTFLMKTNDTTCGWS